MTRYSAVYMLAACFFILLSCSKEKPIQKITIAQFGDFFLYAPLYIATDGDFFAEKNISVSLISTGGDELTWSAVLSGEAQFGVADPTFIAIAAQRGQPGKVIASVVNGVPFWGITTKKDIPKIKSGRDLDSHIVATFPAPSTAYTLQRSMFQEANLKPRIREGAPGTLLSLVDAKAADIALELEPNVSLAVSKGARIVYSMKELYGDFAITGLTTTPKMVMEKPELIEDVVCALQKSLDFIRIYPDSALSILLKRFPEIDHQVANQALLRVIEENIVPSTTVISDFAWAQAIDLRKKVGELNKDNQYDELLDNTFAKKAEQLCRLKSEN